MVLSTDIAHSLGDAFGVELGPEPTEIAPNLWGQESDVFHNVTKYWGRIQEYAASVLRWRGPGRRDGRRDDGAARHGRGGQPAVDRRAPRLGRLRRGGGRCRPDRRDAAAPLHAGSGPLVDGEDRAHRPPDQQADRARSSSAWSGMPMPGERGLRCRRGALPQAGAHARPADRSRSDIGAGGADPGAGGDQGGAALLHLLPPVRLPDRPGGRQPHPAGRRWLEVFPGLV